MKRINNTHISSVRISKLRYPAPNFRETNMEGKTTGLWAHSTVRRGFKQIHFETWTFSDEPNVNLPFKQNAQNPSNKYCISLSRLFTSQKTRSPLSVPSSGGNWRIPALELENRMRRVKIILIDRRRVQLHIVSK